MTENENKNINSIDDKLFKVKYTPSPDDCHLNPVSDDCATCVSKVCTIVCPAKVYEWDEDRKKLVVGYENCLECGACRIVCEKQTLDWRYPKGTNGVTFKFS